MEALRVLVVDDHPIMRHGLNVTLGGEPWVAEVLEAGTVEEAVRVAVTERPDLVVMDVRLPDGDGIEATRRILRSVPSATVLVLTMDADAGLATEAIAAGAHGFLIKDLDLLDLTSNLRAVAGGSFVLSPRVSLLLSGGPTSRLKPPLDQLTSRELEILTLIVKLSPTSRIARQLGVSEKTIRNQLSAIYGKLDVHDRVEAALLAQRLGLTA